MEAGSIEFTEQRTLTKASWMHRRDFLGLAAAFGTLPLARSVTSVFAAPDGHVEAQAAAAPSNPAAAGERALGLGSTRDGLLYMPRGYDAARPISLAVMLHGAGQNGQRMRPLFPLADDFGVVIVAPDSRDRTWDGIRGEAGPDAAFISLALGSVVADLGARPQKLAIGGFSDGASYALGLGNGDLFSHVIALSPGFVTSGLRRGKPHVFVSHGTQDQILPIDRTSRVIVPKLKAAGYDVLYREFDGPHRLLPEIAREAFDWLMK